MTPGPTRPALFGTARSASVRSVPMGQTSRSQMDVKKSVDEYEALITKYGVKEIFDDSGVWFRGKDAREFANEIISRGLHKKGCYRVQYPVRVPRPRDDLLAGEGELSVCLARF